MDIFHLTGILRIYEFPDDAALAEYAPWWPRFSTSEKEREARLVVEAHNLVTSAGRSQILTFIGASSTTTAFAQQFAVGTGTIYMVQPSDTSLASELFRLAPSSFSVVGNAVTISTNFSTSQANGNWTEAGIFGNGATSTANSGTMMTHVLAQYGKLNTFAVTNDYTISLT